MSRSPLSASIADQTATCITAAEALADHLSALADLHYQGGSDPLFMADEATKAAVISVIVRMQPALDRLDGLMASR